MDLYFWAPGGDRPLGRAAVAGSAVGLAPGADPGFAVAFEALAAREALPLVVRRRTAEGGWELVASEVAPGEPDHWVALADALGRETGCVTTLGPESPT